MGTDTVCAMEGVTVFCDVLKKMMLIPVSTSEDDDNTSSSSSSDSDDSSDMSNVTATKYTGKAGYRRHLGFASDSDLDLEALLNDESKGFTVFVPTDDAFAKVETAFAALNEEEAGRVIMFHFYEGMLLTSDTLACGEKISSMNEKGDESRTECKGDNKYQNGNGNTKTGTMPEMLIPADTMACNGVIHTLDEVMFPVSLSQLEADSSSDESEDDDSSLSSGDMSNVTASKGMLTGVIPNIKNPIPSIGNPLNAVSGAIGSLSVPSLGGVYGTVTGAIDTALSTVGLSF